MKKVNEFEIKITKAIITEINIELREDSPTWTVKGQLLTQQGMKVSDFFFSNISYFSEDKKIDVPLEANYHAKELFQQFTPVIMEKLGNMFTALPDGKKKNKCTCDPQCKVDEMDCQKCKVCQDKYIPF